MVQGQLRQTIMETPSQPIKAGVMACTYHPSYEGSVNRTAVQASPAIK
jgi:hypothetical protein